MCLKKERLFGALVQWVINYVPLCVFSSSSQHHAFPVSQQVVDGGNEVSSDLPDSWGKFAHQFHLEKERGVASLTADDNQQWRYEPHQKQCGKICALFGEKRLRINEMKCSESWEFKRTLDSYTCPIKNRGKSKSKLNWIIKNRYSLLAPV